MEGGSWRSYGIRAVSGGGGSGRGRAGRGSAAEKKDVAERQKELMAEAKARGYDTKVMRKVIALRKRDKDDIAEEEAILEMYKAALGMV